MKKLLLSMIFVLTSIFTFSQITTIYTEDFSNDWKKGAITYGGVTPAQPTDGNWSWVNVGTPDNDGGSATSWNDMSSMDGAAVMSTNGSNSTTLAFRWNDVNDGSTTNRVDWYSKSITGAYTTITASLTYVIGNGSGANSVWAYYQIDGGSWTLFGSSVNQSTASGTFTSSSLSCTSSIRIKVEALTRNNNSAYVTIDNVQITACPVLVPSVSISETSNNICSGTSVTFTATPTNGGTIPTYQWKLNGSNVGINSTTFTNSGLINSDIVSCVMTSNASCASPTTATSNSVTMTVTSNVTPLVSITGTSNICTGTSTTFTATPTNDGTIPTYQWKLNGSNVGINSTTYTNSGLINSDIVSCVMTANNTCQTTSTATSNSITMLVSQPSVGGSVAADQNVLSGGDAETVNLSGYTGSVIKWQRDVVSTFNTATDVANTTTFVNGPSMGGITQTIYYRAVVQNGTCPSVNSAYVTITVVNGLPIELLYFSGMEYGRVNNLYWSTASENNNDYFTIERSIDGNSWQEINRQKGADNSVYQLSYSFVDEYMDKVVNYYKLKQTDYDGKFKYSDIISIDNRMNSNPKKIDKITNTLGQEVDIEYYKGLIIIRYTNGSSEKIIK
jgi:hypothetical protein